MLVSVFCTFFTFSSCIFRVAEIRNCLFIENNVSFFQIHRIYLCNIRCAIVKHYTIKNPFQDITKGWAKHPPLTTYCISRSTAFYPLFRGGIQNAPPLFIHILSVYTFSQNSGKVIPKHLNPDKFVQVQICYAENPIHLHFKIIAQYNLPFAVHLLQYS